MGEGGGQHRNHRLLNVTIHSDATTVFTPGFLDAAAQAVDKPMPRKSLYKHILGGFVIAVVAGLMYSGDVSSEAGIAIIMGVAAALGIYETGRRKGHKEGPNR